MENEGFLYRDCSINTVFIDQCRQEGLDIRPKDESFRVRFLEMTLLSLGVAGLNPGFGYLIRMFIGINI